MRRLYDITPTQESFSNGGGEYCKTILLELLNQNKTDFDVLIRKNTDIDKDILNAIESTNLNIRCFHNKKELCEVINEYDLFYSALPYKYYDIKIRPEVVFMYTIHGLRDLEKSYDKYYLEYEGYNIKTIIKSFIFLLYPRFFRVRSKKRMKSLFRVTKNRKIIVVSNHTKFSIMNHFNGIDNNEIEVLYSPPKKIFAEYSEFVIEMPFLLMISGDRWIKNDLRAAIAIDQLISERKIIHKTIIVGVKNKNTYLRNIKNKDSFILCDYIEDCKLEELYRQADVFIYPSLNEGFGYPPIEALRHGTISICAADSSIPEICGNSVLYFNPYDIMEIRIRILEALDSNIQDDLRKKMLPHYEYISVKQKNSLERMCNLFYAT